MEWLVEYTDEFGAWWDGLTDMEQRSVDSSVGLLRKSGPALGRPHADTVKGSRHANMKELRIQHGGRPYRVLYAFDPRRCAILLLGGEKTGKARWYREFVPKADAIYDEHLRALGETDG
ncbi:MAG TPA: type II toxin-antitoxin system RelE/ParE family toxin [Verrucomicrobiae bacterium]|nr:type II toxin-antitoxin system RelE/ParE family toxin [Verrucomicrobiae bacterium]